MKKNIGPTDKIIRIIIAVIIMALYYFGKISDTTTAMVLLVIGIVLLLTSLINFCPLYRIIGVNTCKKK